MSLLFGDLIHRCMYLQLIFSVIMSADVCVLDHLQCCSIVLLVLFLATQWGSYARSEWPADTSFDRCEGGGAPWQDRQAIDDALCVTHCSNIWLKLWAPVIMMNNSNIRRTTVPHIKQRRHLPLTHKIMGRASNVLQSRVPQRSCAPVSTLVITSAEAFTVAVSGL